MTRNWVLSIVFAVSTVFGASDSDSKDAGHAAYDHLPPYSEEFQFDSSVELEGVAGLLHNSSVGYLPRYESMPMTLLAGAIIIAFFKLASGKLEFIPNNKLQNFAEFIVESIYNFLEGIMSSPHQAYLLVLGFRFLHHSFSNWLGLIPGLGTFGIQTGDR